MPTLPRLPTFYYYDLQQTMLYIFYHQSKPLCLAAFSYQGFPILIVWSVGGLAQPVHPRSTQLEWESPVSHTVSDMMKQLLCYDKKATL